MGEEKEVDRHGFIHEKLDIKILILYILRRLPEEVSFDRLTEFVMIDDGFDYFEYTQCLSELVNTGHVTLRDNYYRITKKGEEHGDTVESSIPYSVRAKANGIIAPTIEQMRRDALIGTSHKVNNDGSCTMKLTLSDGVGDILKLSILTSNQQQTAEMEKYFRANAETIYHQIIGLLTPEK